MRTSSLWKRWTALALSLVLVLGMLPLTAGAGSVNPGSYLSSSAYYGNKSKCKMDAAMAYGYAQALKNLGSDYRAKLVDVAGDGMPLMVTAKVDPYGYIETIDHPNGHFKMFDVHIWTWNGTKAQSYNFFKDADHNNIADYQFGSYKGNRVVCVADGSAMDEGDSYGFLCYQVANGQLKLIHHQVRYDTVVRDGIAYGSLIPLVSSVKALGGESHCAPAKDLAKAGWIYDGENGYFLIKVNGKYLFNVNECGEFYENDDVWNCFKPDINILSGYEAGMLEGTWSTASSLRSSLLAYVEATGDFVDVSQSHYAYDPVVWAVKEGITNGTSATTFSPDQTCTQGQILTFLWRAVGEPKATIANPFTNSAVTSGQYYYNAMLWAYEQGIVTSKSLNPNAGCQRSDVALYLWRLAGSPAAGGATFSDVSSSAPYAQAVAWAVKEGITNGTSATTFSPGATCTRGQIVTFLYRDLA